MPNPLIELPLFPLSTVVMPDGLLPLRLFELRYLDMVKNCFKEGTGFGVCLIRSGHEAGQPAEPYPCGTEVRIIDFDQGADGLLQITAQGTQEFDLLDWSEAADGLLLGKVQLADRSPRLPVHQHYETLRDKLRLILEYVESHIKYQETELDNAEWVVNRLLELLPLDAETRYEIIKDRNIESRLAALNELNFTIKSA